MSRSVTQPISFHKNLPQIPIQLYPHQLWYKYKQYSCINQQVNLLDISYWLLLRSLMLSFCQGVSTF